MSLGKIIDKKYNDLSKRVDMKKIPEHIAIIMDGNGRWAAKKGLPRSFGHKSGVSVLKEILKASKELGCKVLTVYAFSTKLDKTNRRSQLPYKSFLRSVEKRN